MSIATNRQLVLYTPQRKIKSFRFLDFFMIVICLSISSVCVYYFYLSLTQTLSSNLDPVGTVTIKYNSVQRRMGDRVLWDRIFNESPLYPGDIIRVAEYSGASLNFDNNQIDLEDNTLIRVTVDRLGQPRIELSSGTLNFTSTEESGNISLVIGGRVIEADLNTVLSVTALEEEGMTLRVIDGNATITNETGEIIEASGGTMITLVAEQELVTAVIEELLETQEDTDIQDILSEAETPSPPPPLAAPRNMRPARNTNINASQFKALSSLDFSWSAVTGANAYILTIFHETANGRRQVIRTNPFTAPRYSLRDLKMLDRGRFIWQVEPVATHASGTILRRGNIGESSFVINVPVPEVQLNETRNLYDQ